MKFKRYVTRPGIIIGFAVLYCICWAVVILLAALVMVVLLPFDGREGWNTYKETFFTGNKYCPTGFPQERWCRPWMNPYADRNRFRTIAGWAIYTIKNLR